MEFNIGDKVKVIYTGYFINRKYSKLNDILTIKDFNNYDESLYQNYINFTNGDRMGFNGEDSRLELVQETYTLKECQEQGISIFCETREQAEKIHQVLEGEPLSKVVTLFPIEVRISGKDKLRFNYNDSTHERDGYVGKGYGVNKVIDFEQVIFEVKKQVSWKIKSGFEKAVDAIILTNKVFSINSISERRLKELNVLELFCEPVYEEKKPVTIYKDKIEIVISDKIVANGVTINLEKLKDIISYSEKPSTYTQLNGWNANPIKITEWKIGCTTFTIDELKSIVKQFELWNS